MANDITSNPLIIDTESATALTTKTFKAYKIRWVGSTTAGHLVSIQNAGSQVKWAAEANGANYTESESFPDDCRLVFEGLKVPDLDSGKIYIYVADAIPIRT